MINKINSHVDPKVFWWSNFMIYLLVFTAVFLGDDLSLLLDNLRSQFISSFGWSYMVFSISLIAMLLYVVFKFGRLRIGGKDSKPDFSRLSWLSMLFSAGLGTGLIYAGIFEPLAHFYKAPQISNFVGNQKFIEAMDITFYHWGFPAWMMYSSAGLIFAILSFNLKKTFQFAHFIPERYLKTKVMVNVAAILSILIGVITTFVVASTQMTAGLLRIVPEWFGAFVTPNSAIALVTLLATFSVLSGLKRGIRILSLINVLIAFSLFMFILFNIDFYFFSSAFVQTLGLHLKSLPSHLLYRSFTNDSDWLSSWTLLYWAWWTAWLPFVGLFIARISKGRTIKEYAFGTVVVPSLVTFLWFGVFGSAGYLKNIEYKLGLEAMVDTNASNILFTVLETMPFSEICTALAVLCVLIFYVTSSDSGSYVVDMISSGKAENHNSYLKVYWSLLEGALAIVLLTFGGVGAVKSLVILISLPVLIYLCYGMFKLVSILEKIKKEEQT